MSRILPIFALFSRSLMLEWRARATHVMRIAVALFLLFALVVAYQESGTGSGTGYAFFIALTTVNWFTIFSSGISFFSNVITEEKEEQILGLLRMTNLNSLAILLGKSTSRLVSAILLLALQLPFTVLAITLGGVLVEQVWGAYLALFVFLAFVANLGLFFSVISQRSRSAAALTTSTLVALWIVPWILSLVEYWLSRSSSALIVEWGRLIGRGAEVLQTMLVWPRLMEIHQTAFAGGIWDASLLPPAVTSVVLFAAAWFLFERDRRDDTPALKAADRRRPGPRPVRPRRAHSAPHAWHFYHFGAWGVPFVFVKLATYAVAATLFATFVAQVNFNGLRREDFGAIFMIVGYFGLLLEVSIIGERFFAAEVRWKTLSTLLVLPISFSDWARQRMRGALVSLIPVFSIGCFGMLLIADELLDGMDDLFREPEAWPVVWFFLTAPILHGYLTAWFSLRVKRGASLIALALEFGAMIFCGFLSARSPSVPFFLLSGAGAVVTVAIHFAFPDRVRRIAAQM